MTAFGPLDLNDEYTEKLWKYLLGWLSDEGATSAHLACITAIKILRYNSTFLFLIFCYILNFN